MKQTDGKRLGDRRKCVMTTETAGQLSHIRRAMQKFETAYENVTTRDWLREYIKKSEKSKKYGKQKREAKMTKTCLMIVDTGKIYCLFGVNKIILVCLLFVSQMTFFLKGSGRGVLLSKDEHLF